MKKRGLMKFVIAAIVVIVACVGFTGCMDDVKDVYKGTDSEEPNTFDYSTKKTVEFTLKYDVPTGYRVHFEMFSKSPLTLDTYKSYVKDSTLVPFYSGRADENGKVTYKGDLPTTVNEIYAYCSGFGMPVLMKASVNDAGGVSEFKVAEIPTASSTRAATGASGTSFWQTYNVKIARPILPSVNKIIISQEDKTLIDKSFPDDQNYDIVKTYYQPSIKLLDKARVKIYSVSNGAYSDRTNALAYFTYKNEKVQPNDINSNLNLVFPELNKAIPAEGVGYQLLNNGDEIFEAGTYIGFALFPNFKSSETVINNAEVLYSCFDTSSWNIYSFPSKNSSDKGLSRASVPHMVLSLLRKKGDNAIIAIAFEDQPWSTAYGTNRGDFRDDVFILEIDPATSLPGDLPTPPTDEPTYDSEHNSSGILCFEDSWPEKGDYDMNDAVISYERTLCISNTAGPVVMKETYTFLNNGAKFTNGFGYQLTGLKKSDVIKCEVKSDYSCQGQGLDATLSDATVMLFDNGKDVKPGTTFSVYTSFNNGQYLASVNPFIVVRGFGVSDDYLSAGRMEVHLPTSTQNAITKYLPTSKANTTYWGTKEDKSDPNKKIYYVRKGNYPFALEVNWDSSANGPLSNFVIPEETASIEKTYPNFTKWVESDGKNNADWYLHPNK